MKDAWKFGSVRYLNGRPLIEGLCGKVELMTPAELTARFVSGELDAALLSIADVFDLENVEIVPGAAIGCRGPVYSVVLAYRGELNQLRRVALDPASRTSSGLLRVVMESFLGIKCEYLPRAESAEEARLIIGDPAIAFRKQASAEWRFLDLGEAWHQQTGLPFVFAVWVVRNSHPDRVAIRQTLQDSLKLGLQNIPQIAAVEADPDFAREYLTRYIRYEFGEEQMQAVARFRELLDEI